jgi:hypothetical protein
MPSIRIRGNTLTELVELDLDEVDAFDNDAYQQRGAAGTDLDRRSHNAELQNQRRANRRKNAVRGARRNSERR